MLGEALGPLRLRSIQIVLYLDDLLIFANRKECLSQQTDRNIFPVSSRLADQCRETSLVPEQIKIFLGYVLNFRVQCTFLPEEKLQRVVTAVKDPQSQVPHSLRHYMSVLGLMTAILAVQWARSHQRPLQAFVV